MWKTTGRRSGTPAQPDPSHLEFLQNSRAYWGCQSQALNAKGVKTVRYPVGLVRQTTQATKAPDSQGVEQTVNTVVGYEYNRAGGLGAVTYPSGRKVSYAADRAGRVSGVNGLMGTTTTTYGAGLEYSEHGALKAAQWGSGLAEAWSFNGRLQPCQIQVTNRQSQAVLAGFELYYGNEAAACGASTVTTNNGNVQKQKILPLGVVQGFGYDSWNRLTHVDEKAGSVEQWRQDYVYDRWGNRAVNSTTSTAPVTNVTPQVADGSAAAMSGRYPGRNRSVMSGATVECGSGNSQYDCAGNMILYGADTASAQKLVYDGENRWWR